MSEELENAARKYVREHYGETPAENIFSSMKKAFEAGAAWHKSQAFMEIIKDIQSGRILIVGPVEDPGPVALDLIRTGGVDLARIKESAIIPEIPPAIVPEILESPLRAQDFTFPSRKYQFPAPGFPKRKKGFHGKGGKRR